MHACLGHAEFETWLCKAVQPPVMQKPAAVSAVPRSQQPSATHTEHYREIKDVEGRRRRHELLASRSQGSSAPQGGPHASCSFERSSIINSVCYFICETMQNTLHLHANENTTVWGLLWLLSRAACLFLECLGLSWRFLFFKSASQQALRARLDRLVKCRVKLISGATAILCILLCQGTCTGAGTITLRQRQYKLMGSLITIAYSLKYFRLCDSCNRLTHLTMFDLMSWYVLMTYCVRASEQDMGDLA